MDATAAQYVPVVDLSVDEATAAAQVREACIKSGFFYVSNHGVPAELHEAMFRQCRALFEQPLEFKRSLLQDANNRGYTPMQEETLDPENQTQGDTKEGFYFGREVFPGNPDWGLPLHGPNQWPDEAVMPEFKPTAKAYYDALNALGFRLLRLLALSLGLESPAFFHPFFERPMVALRPLRYAPVVSDPGNGVYGAGAHSDYGMLTILATDEVPGLQIHTGSSNSSGGGVGGSSDGGCWVDVPPKPGTYIINLGDMLERWTNGLYRSTLHRVVNKLGAERYSIAFFFEPSFNTRVECLPQCCGPDNPPKYPPTTSGQHLLDKYAQTHAGYTAPPTHAA